MSQLSWTSRVVPPREPLGTAAEIGLRYRFGRSLRNAHISPLNRGSAIKGETLSRRGKLAAQLSEPVQNDLDFGAARSP